MIDRVFERTRLDDGTATGRAGVAGRAVLAGLGVLGALAASSCCLIPLALFLVGISGAWIGDLTALAPIFVALTLACLGGGFVMVYRKPKAAARAGEAIVPVLPLAESPKPPSGAPRCRARRHSYFPTPPNSCCEMNQGDRS